jgi:hypothetical protein
LRSVASDAVQRVRNVVAPGVDRIAGSVAGTASITTAASVEVDLVAAGHH